MQGQKKLLLFSLLLPFAVAPIQAAPQWLEKSLDSKPGKISKIVLWAVLGMMAIEHARPEVEARAEKVIKKCTPEEKTVKGKALKKASVKASVDLVGILGGFALTLGLIKLGTIYPITEKIF